ncbi:MAG TPA: hypothetical protein VFK54_09565 [Candidatus Limnocylindrales bacterium]|nr:hypothetical protein [Candidatus Limnocylindrales bacterium]
MRHPIELQIAQERQADLRAASRSAREARIFRAESDTNPRALRLPGLRLAGLRLTLAR